MRYLSSSVVLVVVIIATQDSNLHRDDLQSSSVVLVVVIIATAVMPVNRESLRRSWRGPVNIVSGKIAAFKLFTGRPVDSPSNPALSFPPRAV
jgi:hypothetical protein